MLGGLSLTGEHGVEPRRGRGAWAVGLCAGLAVAAGGLVPGAALGAVYSVSSCADAAGQALPVDGWVGSSTGESAAVNTCPGRGGLYVGMNQLGVAQAPGDFARWAFVAPADTSIASVRLQRDTAVLADRLGHWWYQSEFFVGNPDQGGPVVDACVGRLGCRGRGNPAVPSDPANTVAVGGLSSDQVALQVECRTDGSVAQCPGNGPTPVFYEARQAVIGLTDNVNPVFVSGPDGPLVDPTGYVRGVAGAAFEATDRGSGVYRQILRIDGHPVQSAVPDTNGGLCAQPFVDPVPCKLDMTGSVSYDTTQLADGPHQVQVAVHDATDVNETASAPQTVMVDNTAPTAPLNLRVVGGDAPRPSNDFQVMWDTPPGQVAPVLVAHYRLCSIAGRCTAGQVEGEGITSLDHLRVPGPGAWSLTVFLEDAAGNVNPAATGGPVSLRFGVGGAPSEGGPVLAGRFAVGQGRRLYARYPHGARVSGVLRFGDLPPPPGARVEVLTRDARPHAPLSLVATVPVGGDGAFGYRLAAGFSRAVRLRYRPATTGVPTPPNAGGRAPSELSTDLQLIVEPRVSLSAAVSRVGALTVRGQIAPAPRAPGIEIALRIAGRLYDVAVDRNGRFVVHAAGVGAGQRLSVSGIVRPGTRVALAPAHFRRTLRVGGG